MRPRPRATSSRPRGSLSPWSEPQLVSSRSPEATWSRRFSAGPTEGTSGPRSAGWSSSSRPGWRSPWASGSRSRSRSSPPAQRHFPGSHSPRSPSRSHSPGSDRALLELDGLAVALTISTAVVLCGLLAALHALRETLPGLAVAAAVIAAIALVAFGLPALVLDSAPAAILGLAVYGSSWPCFGPAACAPAGATCTASS